MANELNVSASINFLKNDGSVADTIAKSLDVTGDSYVKGIQEVGTSEEELAQLADLGTPGWCLMTNLDSANFVEVGTVTTEYGIKLKAGEFALFRMNGTSLFAKANTAACLVQYLIVED